MASWAIHQWTTAPFPGSSWDPQTGQQVEAPGDGTLPASANARWARTCLLLSPHLAWLGPLVYGLSACLGRVVQDLLHDHLRRADLRAGEAPDHPAGRPTTSTSTSSTTSTSLAPVVPTTTTTPAPTVPTPIKYICPTPGEYTFPATTLTITETTTVCVGAATMAPPAGVTTAPTAGCPAVTVYPPGTYTAPQIVTTITETSVVVVCPFTTPAPAPTASSIPAPPPPAPTSDVPKEQPQPQPSTPATSPNPPKLGGGNQWAMTYTPYGSGGLCKDAAAVDADIKKIKESGFNSIRVYSTDCDTLPNVGAACKKYSVKMIIGVFVGAPGCDNGNPHVADQIAAIEKWGMWDLVDMAVVGNEALFNGFCTPDQLAALITKVRTMLRSHGCNAPVTTTDTVNGWQAPGVAEKICSVVDVVGANIHAYFNGNVQPSGAGDFVLSQLKIVEGLCGGKTGYVMESGWPSGGLCIDKSCASPDAQAAAIKSIQSVVGGQTVFFSFTNDDWKADGACQCEKSWGCGHLFA
ncbi:hypothetical protein MAPG_02695 [Magnaporthiopsis poae ATCC 64411]|uniref:Probable beta-glucosidase btgE n=1 Tax=Magnaporthiopsis poae (strain ATCC 64411 / 73-15) TaxID=644358 RepID=A0A0C4DS24_MAGP6|nr:hypothetical protein MAPG_02695 [Magnaporthiopsis poae ATCC 64411]